MSFLEFINNAGEHPFVFTGAQGQLQGRLLIPEKTNEASWVAILGHPHSLQGGTMNNKVVTTMARTFRDLGIPSLRFNFRGVENSEGEFDDGVGESEDMLCLARLWSEAQPNSRFIFAGFSFGSYVCYRAAAQWPHNLLISIAPPVDRYDYSAFLPAPAVWYIIQGEEDEVVSAKEVFAFASQAIPFIPVHRFDNTGHFFHGKLRELKEALMDILKMIM